MRCFSFRDCDEIVIKTYLFSPLNCGPFLPIIFDSLGTWRPSPSQILSPVSRASAHSNAVK